MTVIWTGGADITQSVSPAGTFLFKILSIPAGLAVADNSGCLALAIALTSSPGNVTLPVSGSPGVHISVRDAVTGTELVQAAQTDITTQDAVGGIVSLYFAPLNTNGADIWLQGSFTDATEQFWGVVVASVDDAFPPISTDFRITLAGGAYTSGTGVSNVFTPKLAGTNSIDDVIYGIAAETTTSTGLFSFAGDPDWSNVIGRSYRAPPCQTVNPFFNMTASPQGKLIIPNGSLIAGATSMICNYAIFQDGIGTPPTYVDAQVEIDDATGTALAFSPTIRSNDGATIGGTWIVNPLPVGAAQVQIVGIWSGPPGGPAWRIRFGSPFQTSIWCNGAPLHYWIAGIGKFNGDVSLAAIPYNISWPTPDSAASPSVGLWRIDGMERFTSGAHSFAQIIGF